MSSLPTMLTCTEGLVGDVTVVIQPMSIATSKPSSSTKKARVSAGRSDRMFGTALLMVTLRVLPETRRPRSLLAGGRATGSTKVRVVALPLKPPVLPQLARSRERLPAGDGWAYEPKWDGF